MVHADTEVVELAPIHYQDTYAAEVRREKPIEWDELRVAFNKADPWWTHVLMAIRNLLVRPFRLKTGKERPGDTKDLFDFCDEYGRTADMLEIGANDRHLDFRVVFRLGERAGARTVAITTQVRFNRPLGRLYFFFVKPFHRLIVSQMMGRVARILESA